MAELKTKPTEVSPADFVAGIEDERRRADCKALTAMMQEATGAPPVMWGESIVGFGTRGYQYASGRTGDWFVTGFSPRKDAIAVYGCDASNADLLAKLGKHKAGKGCLYIKRLSDVDDTVLRQLIADAAAQKKA